MLSYARRDSMQPTSWEVSVDHEHLSCHRETDVGLAQLPDGNCLFRSVYPFIGLKNPRGYADASFSGCLERSPTSCMGLRRCILPSAMRCGPIARYTLAAVSDWK